MESLQVFLLIVQVVVAIVMIIAVLIQKSGGDSLGGIGGGSGGLNSVMSSKASAGALTKVIMFLVTIFMLNCLILALISSKVSGVDNLQIDEVIERQEKNGDTEGSQIPYIPPVE